jgi:hypothetical protein
LADVAQGGPRKRRLARDVPDEPVGKFSSAARGGLRACYVDRSRASDRFAVAELLRVELGHLKRQLVGRNDFVEISVEEGVRIERKTSSFRFAG